MQSAQMMAGKKGGKKRRVASANWVRLSDADWIGDLMSRLVRPGHRAACDVMGKGGVFRTNLVQKQDISGEIQLKLNPPSPITH